MKIKFCDYIKTAQIGDIFYNQDGVKYVITKIGKEKSIAIEITQNYREEVEWRSEDKDKIILA